MRITDHPRELLEGHRVQIEAYIRIHTAGKHSDPAPASEADWIALSLATQQAASEHQALAALSAKPVSTEALTAALCAHIDSTLPEGQTRAGVLWHMSRMLAGKPPPLYRQSNAFEWMST